jgi:methylenetetrahydrofolate dehydrogenase (NADP+)/methenyltetrahydrofolate cyclohydrolase
MPYSPTHGSRLLTLAPCYPVTAELLDGKALSTKLRESLRVEVADFIENNSVVPTLAAVLVGEDPASQVYVRNKRRACDQVGMESIMHRLPAETTQDELLELVAKLNKDEKVHGILVQLPLPPEIDEQRVLLAVSSMKDVDAFHPENVGRIVQGQPRFLPCTPYGIQQLLIRNNIEIAGQHVVIVGRSDIVGKPMANMLVQRGEGGDATVTICHSRTKNLAEMTRSADILIVAIGRAKFVTADMVRPGAVVVDVGMNRTEEGLVGDVDFAAVREVASYITPVPGGVGPLTITMLLHNTLTAARKLST